MKVKRYRNGPAGWGELGVWRPDLGLEAFRRRAVARESVVIFDDGTQRRDLTQVSNVARALACGLIPAPAKNS